ncbi:MAG TPA: acetyl-CoA carboxylase carboxyltransferase subunit alpha [Alphaproteobacteria bacterium]|jgi:acetyl-CoA carboxylase carboxyl transferase subunit alpha|nr:acetyl-CoA carboxylase carboxyltransferase subunit alpha [Alphaproteobacteria bacterium]
MNAFLDFEKPIAELEGKIKELRHLAEEGDVNIAEEVSKLEAKAEQQLRLTYANLTPWQKTLVARHQDRPHMSAYVARLIEDYTPLAGDRAYGEDRAVCGGLGRFRGRSVMVLGHEKGNGTDGRVRHNFGMAQPEGYRKAVRLMELAERFRLPVISFVDTPGAHPGVGAEERGQSEAIARSIEACLDLTVPLLAVIIGEGGSGGAVALAAGNRVCMLEHAIYSVISPEGCASILWHSAERAQDAAEALKLTAQDLQRLAVIDEVVDEPIGGAHRLPEAAIEAVGEALARALDDLVERAPDRLRDERRQKFLAMGRAGPPK